MLLVLSFLNSCRTINYDNCPTYPIAGPTVATELITLDPAKYPATWEWLARINKLREELELCK